ncbi:nitric oxide reductase NorE protein [Aquimarina sp. EL_43]|uniref:cytochrome c oxidase subunit 3 n=1 Tax=Aquimarina TaxID=290174 RepID=UPI00046EAE8F|nr:MULTISPECIES: cytochrome c oxidase subunit 3 [Aquimarina]MBG6129868.1 nitric oxide reductase NorE protein [Aquimarina sp. EL_35]MBG6150933.1 nitric oxide reductase NorE protein [Aquimarina sp. EL_32]MBG6167760.1 nitric oxide reductase NorE protein [Aquimarina sp. EL_43]
MKQTTINYSNIYYPPGGILMWIIISLELITFGMAIIAMVYCGKQEPDLFHQSRMLLNPVYGILNTILLLTSGFCMAISVHYLKINIPQKSKILLLVTMLFGILFLLIKTFEYNEKINLGLDINHNLFFTFYWLLTLFHVIHVIVGLVILGSVYFGLRKEKTNIEDVEASASFWHMCDLIWLFIFPIIYLFF